RKRGENLVAQPIKKLVIGNLRRNLALLPVDKEKVNVRAMIQFAAAEFTERKNGKIRCGGAVSFAKFCVAMFEHGADANVRDLRKFTGGLFEGGHCGKLAYRHARHLACFPKSQCREILAGRRIIS